MTTESLPTSRNETIPQRNRLIAAREIAATETDRSRQQAKEGVVNPYFLQDLSPQEQVGRLAINAFYEITEGMGTQPEDALAILQLFAETIGPENATLARVEMNGDWNATQTVERQLVSMFSELYENGYKSIKLIGRQEPDEKRFNDIHKSLTNEYGLVAVRRQRRLLIADHDGFIMRPHLEIDKVSTFALDIAQLNRLSSGAADEVRLIIASMMLQSIDLRIFNKVRNIDEYEDASDAVSDIAPLLSSISEEAARRSIHTAIDLRRILKQYKIPYETLRERSFDTRHPNRMRDTQGVAFIEDAVAQRSPLLTPASTTYYVHS